MPAALILGTFQYLPAFDVFRLSLTDRLLLRPVSSFIGLDNYQRLFADERFWNSVWNTIYFVGVSVPVQMALALVLALGLARKMRGVGVFRTVFFLPVVASTVAVAVVWRWMYHPNIGILNYFLQLFELSPVRWLQDPTWAMPAVILLAVWSGVGYYMVIYLAGILDIPEDYYEAARLDGAQRWHLFRYITWPMLMPVTYLILILQMINSFQVFTSVYVMTGGGPVRSTEVVVFYLYQRAFESLEFGYASAISVVLFVFLVTLTVVQRLTIGARVNYER
ncbi:MAG: sugar ABC transporter permease [Deinococcota bacterium]|nr:sugar ABC transporter permease [Deinococcota bacterium]